MSCRVFVGARKASSGQILIGAFGLSEDVFQATTDAFNGHLSNGVYWYNYVGRAFGFAAEQSIDLSPGDVSSSDSENRLSWLLDIGLGGYRAGSVPLSQNISKVIYMLLVPSPSEPQPTSFPTSYPTVQLTCDPWSILPCEIQQYYDMKYIVDAGFELCYQAYYSDSTSQSDLEDCELSNRW